jgi:hypothetical protein
MWRMRCLTIMGKSVSISSSRRGGIIHLNCAGASGKETRISHMRQRETRDIGVHLLFI